MVWAHGIALSSQAALGLSTIIPLPIISSLCYASTRTVAIEISCLRHPVRALAASRPPFAAPSVDHLTQRRSIPFSPSHTLCLLHPRSTIWKGGRDCVNPVDHPPLGSIHTARTDFCDGSSVDWRRFSSSDQGLGCLATCFSHSACHRSGYPICSADTGLSTEVHTRGTGQTHLTEQNNGRVCLANSQLECTARDILKRSGSEACSQNERPGQRYCGVASTPADGNVEVFRGSSESFNAPSVRGGSGCSTAADLLCSCGPGTFRGYQGRSPVP